MRIERGWQLVLIAVLCGIGSGVGRSEYVTSGQFDLEALLGDPPADSSPQHRAELDKLLSLQADRTAAQERQCKAEERVSVFYFEPVLGSWFKATDLTATDELFRRVDLDLRMVGGLAKQKWRRPRPPAADKRIHPCVTLERSSSYPSGHAIRGIVWATLLAQMFPEKRQALLARGRQLGQDRLIAGMHWPSDVAAGQTLGADIAKKMLENSGCAADLQKAAAECRRLQSHG